MLGSFVPCLARYGVFQLPSGEWFNYLCDALRGKPSILAEPVEDFFILLCPFIPFGTCGWGSQHKVTNESPIDHASDQENEENGDNLSEVNCKAD